MAREGSGVEGGSAQAVSRLQRQLSAWRRTGPRRRRIPEQLWERAVALAQSRGVHFVARALRLDYYSLKRRLTASAMTASQRTQRFVEVAVVPGAGETSAPAVAVVEVERRDGGRMRLHAVTAAGLSALCETFWRSRSRA